MSSWSRFGRRWRRRRATADWAVGARRSFRRFLASGAGAATDRVGGKPRSSLSVVRRLQLRPGSGSSQMISRRLEMKTPHGAHNHRTTRSEKGNERKVNKKESGGDGEEM